MKVDLEVFKAPCQCGKQHDLWVEAIYIEENARFKIRGFIEARCIQGKIALICDSNTYPMAKQVREALNESDTYYILLDEKNLPTATLKADEYAVKVIQEKLSLDTQLLIAVGAGTIHDLTRYVAKEQGIAFISVPTAASVDGFVSTVCAMTLNGFKVTTPGVSPLAVFADSQFFAHAPSRLNASGVSDLLGKYTALVDWKIAHLLTGEVICERIIQIEEEAIKQVVRSLADLAEGKTEAYEYLMYGLILSGLAMQMVGNSRPASGAEHHISHLWEMHIINKELDALHGEKVGVALGLVCDFYKKILEVSDLESLLIPYRGLPIEVLEKSFGTFTQDIIKENSLDPLKNLQSQQFIKQLETIKNLISQLPTGTQVQELLKKVGAKTTLEDIGLNTDILECTFKMAPYVRSRLTFMRVLTLLKFPL